MSAETEWGLLYTSPYGSHVTQCDEDEARARVANEPLQRGCSIVLVSRTVTVTPWREEADTARHRAAEGGGS